VEELKQSVREVCDPQSTLAAGETRVKHAFVEYSRPLWKLLKNEKWLRIQQHFHGTDDLSLHRSAAILKNVGAPALEWHTDWCGYAPQPPRNANEVLNRSEGPSGMW